MAATGDIQTKFAQILLNRIRNDTYPSWTEMRILEATLPDELVDDYLNVLLEKVASARPSITMLRHIQRLVVATGR